MPEPRADLKDDAALVSEAQAGDADAFGVLFDRYAAGIFKFLCLQLSDDFEAEDLTSEIFLKAWRSLPRYRELGHPFSSFLFRIARNVLVDYYRKTRNKVYVSRSQADTLVDQKRLEELSDQNQENERIRKALSRLRVDYRTVIVLRFINGFSSKETAQIMGRSEGAVRVLQHRALKAMRDRLV